MPDTAFSPEAVAAFTGDALFIGDVGRTDFYPDRAEEVAGLLYDSIFGKLLPLGDHVLVCPAHGAGSVCGSGMAAREFSTLGFERRANPALQVGDRDEFIRNKTSEHHYIPPYFKRMEQYNKNGSAPPLTELPNPRPMDPEDFQAAADRGVVVDIREPEAFCGAFVPGSLNIPLDMLPAYAGYLLDYDHDILLVASDTRDVDTAVRYLARIGFDRIAGYLRGGVHAWEVTGRELDSIAVVHAATLRDRIQGQVEAPTVLDVRKIDEYRAGHLDNAVHVFLGHLPGKVDELDTDGEVVTFCGSGRRASIAASILRRHGVERAANNLGSMAACKAVGCPIVS